MSAAAPCNLTDVWQSIGSDDPITVVMDYTTYAFVATAASGFTNQPGQYFPGNSSLSFTCCGGIVGSIDASCTTISWADANKDEWARGSGVGAYGEIASPLLKVGISSYPIGSIAVDTFSFFGAGANTSNFAASGRGGGTTLGGTLTLPASAGRAGKGAVAPRCGAGCTLTSTPSSVTVSNVVMAGVGNETWSLTLLNSTSFSLRIDRVYGAGAVELSADRLALALRTTGGLPIHSEQIPGFVDLDVFVNATSTGGFDLGNGEFEFLSPNSRQFVRFTPTGALFIVEGAATMGGAPLPALFSFAKPFADGTAPCSIGFETIDPRVGSRAAPAPGTMQTIEITFNLVETDIPLDGGGLGPFPRMDVALSNASLQGQMVQLLGAQYQLLGFIMGNNPASVPCLHEMAWWPMMSSLFDAGSVAFAAMQQELSFFAGCGWAPFPYVEQGGQYQYVHSCNITDGSRFGLTQRYASSGFYNCPWGPLEDEDVMFSIAVWFAATSSGDTAWLRSLQPALAAVEQFLAASGLTLDNGGKPVVFTSPASGIADGGRHASNWFDVVLFGNLDSYLAVHGVWAMACLAEIYASLGDAAGAARASAIHAKAVADFNSVFWLDSQKQYIDWIDTSGKQREYFYVDTAFVAIFAGIASPTQASALLDHYDSRLAEIYESYNVTPGTIWSAPCNLYPITDPKEYANSAGDMTFPMYENGGAFFHTPGLQFAALGAAGRADAAYAGFVTLMNSGFGEIRGWAQQLYWAPNHGPGSLVGGDPLNTAALSIWGFMRAAFGAAPTLTRGVVSVGAPAKAAEGARWNLSHLGLSVCLVVNAGVTTFCNGTALAPGRAFGL